MNLTEEMRLNAGLQESKNVENPLPKFLEARKQQAILEAQRKINETKSVITNIELFQRKMEKYQSMINKVTSVCVEGEVKTFFISGLYESKYPHLQKFADMVINDDMPKAIGYMDEYYESLQDDLKELNMLVETVDVENAPSYFVTKPLISADLNDVNVEVFKYRTLKGKVSNEIPYGAEIKQLSEGISLVRYDGKKFYSSFTAAQISQLENDGLLI